MTWTLQGCKVKGFRFQGLIEFLDIGPGMLGFQTCDLWVGPSL